MGFLVDGQNRTLLTGSLSADQWVTTPYLFNAGGSVQVPAPQAPDTFGIVSGVQTWSAKTFLQPIVTSGSFTSIAIGGTLNISQCACTLSAPVITSGTFTKPVISSATMTSPTIAGGGTWTSGTITSGTIQSGTFTSPTVAMGTASFMTIQSGVLQTCKLTSPAIALTGGQASGGVIANGVVACLPSTTLADYADAIIKAFDCDQAGFVRAVTVWTGSSLVSLSFTTRSTGDLYYIIADNTQGTGELYIHLPSSTLTPYNTQTMTILAGKLDMYAILCDGVNYVMCGNQRGLS